MFLTHFIKILCGKLNTGWHDPPHLSATWESKTNTVSPYLLEPDRGRIKEVAKSNKDTSMVGEKKRAGQSNIDKKVDNANIKRGGLKWQGHRIHVLKFFWLWTRKECKELPASKRPISEVSLLKGDVSGKSLEILKGNWSKCQRRVPGCMVLFRAVYFCYWNWRVLAFKSAANSECYVV